MILVILLAGMEKLINFAIHSDQLTKLGLQPLSGKVMRLKIKSLELEVDTIFNDDSIRFEPVDHATFENNNNINDPNCTISIEDPTELLNLIKSPGGNLPIEGDYRILMHIRELIAGFSPDITSQLEPFIGVMMASQLSLVLAHLKDSLSTMTKSTFTEFSEIRSSQINASRDEFNKLQQELLKTRSEIEREKAQLELLKAESKLLKNEH